MSVPNTAAQKDSPSPQSRRPVLTWLNKRWQKWRARHRHPFDFAIHMILGIPLLLAGIILLIAYPASWYWGVGALALSYLFQYIGHSVEGNDVGEWAAIKRLLGLPYVAISPRFQESAPNATSHQSAAPAK